MIYHIDFSTETVKVRFIYKNFDENFIVQLSFLDENFIQEILSDNK